MIVSYVLSFVLSLFLVMGSVCLTALTSLFSENFFVNVIQEDYYRTVLSEIVTEAEDYTIPVGFDISVVEGVFTMDDVRRDINGHVTAAFNGYEYTPDLSEANIRLYANALADVREKNIKVEGQTEEVITTYVGEIDEFYLDKVKIPGITLIKTAREKVRGGVTAGLLVLFVLSFVIAVTLLKLYHYPHQGMRYIAYAAGSCALMLFAVPFGLYRAKVYARVFVTPEYFYVFVSNYIRQVLITFMQAALIWGLVMALCIVFIVLSRNGTIGGGRLRKRLQKKLGLLPRRR